MSHPVGIDKSSHCSLDKITEIKMKRIVYVSVISLMINGCASKTVEPVVTVPPASAP